MTTSTIMARRKGEPQNYVEGEMAEHNMPFWIAAIDFQKTFDTVDHDSLWTALVGAGVPSAYMKTLATLYKGRFGVVVDETKGRLFQIKRGTKQGDPPSNLQCCLAGGVRRGSAQVGKQEIWSAGYGRWEE